MAILRLVLSSDPRRLVESGADEFLSPVRATAANPFPSPGYLLALRQGGLRDDLVAAAAARGVSGWFDPPICLFAQLPELLVDDRLAVCGDYERLVLLADALRCTGRHVFADARRADAYVDAVDRLFGELLGEGVDADRLAAAFARPAGRDAFESGRDADLVAAFRDYTSRLREGERRDPRARLIACAEALRADPGALAGRLHGRRAIRLVGLQDLRGGWRELLHALRASPALDSVAVYTSVRLDRDEGLRPDEVVTLDLEPSWTDRLFVVPVADRPAALPRPDLLAAPDAEREVEHVAVRVRALIDGGTVPSRIAIVARNARPYTDLVLGALARVGVPASARRRVTFQDIPVVRSVLSLFAVARDGWMRYGLVELAQQPYLGIDLDPLVLNHIGYRRRVDGLDAWTAALGDLLEEAKAREARQDDEAESDRSRTTLPPAWRVEQALADFTVFANHARTLDERRPLRDWVSWLLRLLGDPGWNIERRLFDVKNGHEEIVRLDAAGLRGMHSVLAEWQTALDRWGGGDTTLDAAGFEMRLREMLAGDAIVWTRTRRGVQVIEGLAAAHRSFDHLFLVGLAGGRFPLPVPRSSLLAEHEREALLAAGLPLDTRAQWDSRERELFRALVAVAGSSLTVSWPRIDERGADTVPSAFVEALAGFAGTTRDVPTAAVITPGIPLIVAEDGVAAAVHAATMERDRATGRLSPWNGQIEDPALLSWIAQRFGDGYPWSPTQLETWAKCPWAYFSGRLLHLEKHTEPDIDIDARARGSILHDALKRFYDVARTRVGGPVMLRPADFADWVVPLLHDSLDAALEAAPADVWLGQPALRATKLAELRRMLEKYIEWESEHNEKLLNAGHYTWKRQLRSAVDAHELSFDGLDLVLDGVHIRLRGTIDRVEVGQDDRVPGTAFVAAVDYKTTTWSTPGGGDPAAWSDGVVLQVPLYAHALTRLRPGTRVARVEYRAIRNRDRKHQLDLVYVKNERNGPFFVEPQLEQEAKLRDALSAVAAHVRRVRAGEFPARPAPSCMCPDFCHAWEICRVRGGPQKKW